MSSIHWYYRHLAGHLTMPKFCFIKKIITQRFNFSNICILHNDSNSMIQNEVSSFFADVKNIDVKSPFIFAVSIVSIIIPTIRVSVIIGRLK